jgi:Cu-processing system ATP-binding protein
MITVLNVEKRYKQVKALAGVSLTAHPGKVTGILGPNGCGKTTLIKSILGLVVPDGGEITVGGSTIAGTWSYRRETGYMPQAADFPGNLIVRELFDMLEDIRNTVATRRQELIDLFSLNDQLNRPFGVLSGGTKQKVAVVAAFMFDAKVLVLDEPTVGLDPVAATRLKGLISTAAKSGKTILLVTHMVSEIEQLVDDMIFLLEGKIRFSGTISSIKKTAQTDALDKAIVRLIEEGEKS